jgi:hypothetical protein
VAENFANYLVRGLCSGRASARPTATVRSLNRPRTSLPKKVMNKGAAQW